MKAIVLLNAGAGTLLASEANESEKRVAAQLAAAGIDADIRLVPAPQLQAEAQQAAQAKVDLVIVGGGDGTLSTVAGVLAGTKVPLGILPLGTLNHFAKDLGIPVDLAAAAQVIAAGNVQSVDVGEVNGRVFINNSSLGLYPQMVSEREAEQRRAGIGKWRAMLWAMLKTFMRFPLLNIRLTTDSETAIRRSPLVFVGNNSYQLDLFNIGSRACLNRGELCLYVANAQTRWGIVKLTLRVLLGRLEQSRDFDTLCLSNCRIENRHSRLRVAVDGEVLWMHPPLEYRVRPASLRVCLPVAATLPAANPE